MEENKANKAGGKERVSRSREAAIRRKLRFDLPDIW
jgi:hypothetical protein